MCQSAVVLVVGHAVALVFDEERANSVVMTWTKKFDPTGVEVTKARSIASTRTNHFGNNADHDMTGALGEVAVEMWADQEALTCDPAYADSSRYADADIFLGDGRVSFDVKTCSAGDRFRFPEKQVESLARKAAAVIWCEVLERIDGWDTASYDVTILGWTKSSDVTMSPSCPQNAELRAVPKHLVSDLASLRKFVCGN